VTAYSLLGNYKDGMDTLIRSLQLVDRVKYVRGDPSYVPLSLGSSIHLIAVGENYGLFIRIILSTWCGYLIAL
jgi:hypothetical protein